MAACGACLAATVSGLSGQESEARRVALTQHRAAPAVDPARSADWSDHNGGLANSRYAPLTDGVMYFSSGSAVFALDAATAEPVWTFEMEPRFGGGGRGPGYGDGRIYAIGGPFVYAVDARTGALVESFGDNGVLPAVNRALEFKYPGKYPADVDPVSIGYRINNFHPYLANEFVITSPGQDGGADYGGPAFSPRTGLLYVSGKNDAVSNRVKPVGATLRPGPRSPGHFENLAGTEAHGMEWNQALAAYEPVSGELVWYSEFPGWTNAAHAVAGDVIFHGTGGTGDLIAFDARTGEQVWRYAGDFGPPDGIRTGIMATPMTYRVNGKQYVTVTALDQVLTFALP